MGGLPTPDTSRPYVMWAGTPYAHLMIPVRQDWDTYFFAKKYVPPFQLRVVESMI
jgi:hypothetical protein